MQKKFKERYFLSFGPSCWNCIFKLARWRAFQRRTACPSAVKKSCGSHLFWVGPGKTDEAAFVQELSKAITFLSKSYPNEVSHSSWANQELSTAILAVEMRRRKVALHTSSHLTPIEAWWRSVSTTSEGHGVSREVQLENCTQVFGGGPKLDSVQLTVEEK